MQKNYLTISIVVTVIGIAFILYPSTYEMHFAPEEVTLWEDQQSVMNAFYGSWYQFSFETGEYVIPEYVVPFISVWTDELYTLNTTFFLVEDEVNTFYMNITDTQVELPLSDDTTVNVAIKGNLLEDFSEEEVMVHAGFYYLRYIEPEYFTDYPYRFFGYGMTAIGIIATLVVYISTKQSEK